MVIDFCVETLRRNTQRRMSLETDFRPIIKHMFGLSSDINSGTSKFKNEHGTPSKILIQLSMCRDHRPQRKLILVKTDYRLQLRFLFAKYSLFFYMREYFLPFILKTTKLRFRPFEEEEEIVAKSSCFYWTVCAIDVSLLTLIVTDR